MMIGVTVHHGAVLGGSLMLGLLLAGVFAWVLFLLRFRRSGFAVPMQMNPLQERHWSHTDLVIAVAWIGGALLVFAVVGFYLRRSGMSAQGLHTVAALQNTFLQLLVAVVLWVRMRAAGSTLLGSFGIPGACRMRLSLMLHQAFKWYIVSLPGVFVAALISQGLFAPRGGDRMFQPVLELFTDTATPFWFRWWIAGVAVLAAPVIEEAFFRGVMLPVLLRKYAVWPAIVGCSLLFALVHGHTPAILPLFVFGLGLGGAYLYTGNLLVPICMHALFNGVNLLVLLLYGNALAMAS